MLNLDIKLIDQFKNNDYIPQNISNDKINLSDKIETFYNNETYQKDLLVKLISKNYNLRQITEEYISEELLILDNFDLNWCKEKKLIPLYLEDGVLIVNCYNPLLYFNNKSNINDYLIESYKAKKIELVISTKNLFEKILNIMELTKFHNNQSQINKNNDPILLEANDFIKEMFINAITDNIDEIHFELNDSKTLNSYIKFKQFDSLFVYSLLDDYEKTEKIHNIIERIANSDSNNYGIMSLELSNLQNISFRTSKIKTYYGEKYVFSIMKSIDHISYQELDYPSSYSQIIEKFFNFKNGIFFLLGDYGSGKKRFILNYLNQTNKLISKNVYIVEKPYLFLNKFNYISSYYANDCLGKLEIIQQQSPNLIVLDDYNNEDVLKKAIELSKYCLVLITVNIPNMSFLPRYLLDKNINFDINVSPYIRFIQEQVKYFNLCRSCKEKMSLVDNNNIIKNINLDRLIINEKTHFYKPKGCISCHNLGYNREMFFYNLSCYIKREFKHLSNETQPSNLESDYFHFRNNLSTFVSEIEHGNISIKNLI